MENNFNQYNENKQKVLNSLDKSIEFCQSFNLEELESTFVELKKQTAEGEFTIVVVGEFSAGKSTFLNALMGERFLPSATKETTATVNFLKHKNQSPDGSSIIIYYKNGEKKHLFDEPDLEVLTKYVSTNGDDVVSQIERVDVFLESKFLENNVTLVDSPGLNGVADGHKDITMEQIAKSHACIFMFDSGQPGKATDFNFLTKIKERTENVFFILNQIDKIRQDEGETVDSVISQLKTNYDSQFPGEPLPEIFGTSSLKALVARSSTQMSFNDRSEFSDDEKEKFLTGSLIVEFENRLIHFLTQGEKTYNQLLEPIKRVEKELIMNANGLEEEQNNLEDKKGTEELDDELLEAQKQLEEFEEKLKIESKTIKKDIRAEKRNAITAYREVSRQLKNSLENKSKFIFDDVEALLSNDSLNDELDRFQTKIKTEIGEKIRDIHTSFSEGVELVASNLDESITSSLTIGDVTFNLESDNIDSTITDFDNISSSVSDDKLVELKQQFKKNESLKRDRETQQEYLKQEEQRLSREKAEVNSRQNVYDSHYTKKHTVTERIKRGGIGGGIARIFTGKKFERVHRDVRIENQDFLNFEKDRKLEHQDITSKLKDIYKRKLELSTQKSCSDMVSQEDIDSEMSRIERERERESKRNEREHAREVNGLKRKIKASTEKSIDEAMTQARKQFEESIDKNTALIEESVINEVAGDFRKKIELRKSKIDNLTNQKGSSENQKKEQLNAIEEQLMCQKKLMSHILDNRTTLEMSMQQNADKVEYTH